MRRRSPQSRPLHAVRSLLRRIVSQFRAVAFWTAVLLPVGYTTLLVYGASLALIGSLLAVHAVSLVVGHSYRRSPGDPVGARGEGV